MADYTIVSDVTNYIVKRLREKMCPEPIPSPNGIEPSSPTDQSVDYVLGVHLYDICHEGEVTIPNMMRTGKTRLRKPPKPYTLYYMIFINGSSQMGLKALDIQKILGKVAQVVSDADTVMPTDLQPWLDVSEPPIRLTGAKKNLEEKCRVWQTINKPYQVSLFYRASPVFINSEVVVDAVPVIEADINLNLRGE